MEGLSAITLKETLSAVIVPLSVYAVKSCWHRLRKPKDQKEHLLVLPSKGGKSWLTSKLASQKSVLVVDLDDAIHAFCPAELIEKIELMEKSKMTLHSELYYLEACEIVLSKVREQMKRHNKMRVLYLTSCFEFSRFIPADSVYVCAPHKDFFNEILATYTDEKQKDVVRNNRELFLSSIPFKDAVQLYGSYQQLESMIRNHLKLFPEL